MTDKTHRINQLQKYLSEDPMDAFSKYALALEWQEDEPQKAAALFDDLLSNHPEYTGTYYHAAALFAEIGLRDKAEQVYIRGIDLLRSKNEANALRELQNAYQNFQFED